MARVPYLDGEDVPEAYGAVFDRNRAGATNLYGALANNPPLLDAFVDFARTCWDECGLDEPERELVALTVARQTHADYEWHQHVPLALDAGLPEADVRAVREGRYGDLGSRREALTSYAAAVATASVDDALHRALVERVDDRTVVGVTLLAAVYTGLARFLDALAVGPEESFVGWGLDGLDDGDGTELSREDLLE
ncbi:carboxymuconolactone decarboxylase family protein [Haloglomus irregulare]|uniref:Carboxymuconolactone decarboxylase family protein n=1 Tax=Haloglomus irregulare TaxID=2234134 RepID=A0A554NE37_9EURY|nr:carboxymuconolactone decarboxylase family protein [Haloglomus irregulare]TSD15652.1 carboxymuconolactone decarboxylase family protein [Haloglomus irregulare]